MQNGDHPTRRDVMSLLTGSLALGAGSALATPARAQAKSDSFRPPPPVRLDLAPIRPGQIVTVAWNARPVVIRHRTAQEIALARAVPIDSLRDRNARNAALPRNAPATDENRAAPGRPEWLIVIGICTHLGCRLSTSDRAERSEGWFCPCHAARFDLAGRVQSGPAHVNLAVPPYRFLSATRVQIGRA